MRYGDYEITPATRRSEESVKELLHDALRGPLPNPEGQEDTDALTGAQTKDTALSCTTPCDDDCTADCHEWHYVLWKREHQPEECPGKTVDNPAE